MAKRLDILKNSLEKKEKKFNEKLQNHFSSVKQANGQPLNDKRNGSATLKKWELQDNILHNLQESIEKTKVAIEIEEDKIMGVSLEYDAMPQQLKKLIDNGTLTQWRKHPHILFVNGVKKARIIWDKKKQKVFHNYVSCIEDKEKYIIFRDVYNDIIKSLG